MRSIIQSGIVAFALALGVAAGGGVAHAQSATAQQQAEDFYTKGDTAYNLGRYDEAVDWFTKAYEAWPQPEFLYNIAQSYRLGGNCKQALHFYKRFKSLKEKDKDAPLSKKKKAEIDGFIKDLQDCADKADNISGQQPDGVDHPEGHGTDTTTTGHDTTTTTGTDTTTTGHDTTTTGHDTTTTGHDTTTTGHDTTTGTDTTTTGHDTTTTTGHDTTTTTAANTDGDDGDDGDDGGDLTVVKPVAQPTLLSLRAGGGIGLISAGSSNKVPPQPAIGITAGYPIPVGPVRLDVGASFSFSPLPYPVMSKTQTATLIGLLADVGVNYPINDKIGARFDGGVGVLAFGGLVDGNPFTDTRKGASGALGMLNVRAAIAADYAITNNLLVSVTPFAFSFSPPAAHLAMDSLTQIDFMVGLGYKM